MRPAKHDDGGFGHSMTDLMAGVAVTFLIIAVIFMVQKQRTALEHEEKLKKADEPAITRLEALRDRLAGIGDVAVLYDKQKDPLLLTVVMKSKEYLSFKDGSCEVSNGEEFVQAVFQGVLEPVCRTAESGYLQSITLEGHTDNVRYWSGKRECGVLATDQDAEALLANNIRLSAARAQNVFWTARKHLKDSGLISCLEQRFVVSGRGPVEPAVGPASDWAKAQTEDQRRQNRRVVIKIRAQARTAAEVFAGQ